MNDMPTSLIRRDEVVRHILLLRNRLEEMAEAYAPVQEVIDEQVTLKELYFTLEAIIALRKRRSTVFGQDLFGEPAWDMLLELYRNEIICKVESVSSICYASGVPPTTALRWLSALERGGWINRSADGVDRRKFNVSLTDRSRQALDNLFTPRNFLNKRVALAQP